MTPAPSIEAMAKPEPCRVLLNGWRLALVYRGRRWSYVLTQGRARRIRIATNQLVTEELEPEVAARLLASIEAARPSDSDLS